MLRIGLGTGGGKLTNMVRFHEKQHDKQKASSNAGSTNLNIGGITVTTEEELLQHDAQFRYMMLGRMQSDCEAYLDPVFPQNHLWAGNPKDQIKYMRILWKSFPKDEKPIWCTKEMIDGYERMMK